MKNSLFYPFIVGISLMAIGASAKAIVDVAVLSKDNDNIHTTLKMIYNELREARNDIKDLMKNK